MTEHAGGEVVLAIDSFRDNLTMNLGDQHVSDSLAPLSGRYLYRVTFVLVRDRLLADLAGLSEL